MNTTVTTEQPVSITGELSPKRVGTYMKQSHKTNDIRVQRREDGSFFIADGYVAVWVPQHPDLLPFTFFPIEWERATFKAKEDTANDGNGPDIETMWRSWLRGEQDTLTLTKFLFEMGAGQNQVGKFYRKFIMMQSQELRELSDFSEEKYVTYLDKKICDLLTPGIDELEGFRFETAGHEKPVRVAARNGYVAVIMPLVNVKL